MTKYSENALNVFKRLYYKKDENDNYIEKTPEEVFQRVSSYVANGDLELENMFYELMRDNYFRPNTPCLINVGVQDKPQTAACFVGGMYDDLLSILNLDREAAIIFASGSGIGANFGVLREKGAPLSSGGASSGPLAFLKKFAATGEAVKSGGRARRAALLIMFFDDHPDLLDFITLKDGKDQESLRSMNISVAISDKFMKAVKDDGDWNLYGVVDNKIKSTHKARDIFNLIAKNAHKSGDPGVWYIDIVNEFNGIKEEYGRIISTNPCGEEPLNSWQCCALASINLSKFIKYGEDDYRNELHFDWNEFKEVIKYGTEFLDNMIEVSGYPTSDYDRVAKATRPLGLGIMGLADTLCLLGIPYDSQKAFDFAEKIAKTMTKTAIETSIELGERFRSFPSLEKNREGMTKLCSKFGVELGENTPLRNSNWTTIAPTGTISISCDCSPGMEPLFGITYTKNVADTNEKWIFVNPIFESKYKNENWYAEAIEKINKNSGSCQGIDCVPKEVQKVWKTAHDIHWKDRIEMQSSLQVCGISSGISSTVNLPKSATVEEIKEIYMLAWEKGLKGITVYRDGCLDNQPVEFSKECKSTEVVPERKKVRSGKTYEVTTGHGKVYITINQDSQGKVLEIFTNGGKHGGVSASNLEAIARLASLALQQGVSVDKIAHTLMGISDGTVVWDKLDETDKKSTQIISIPDAIAQVLHRFYVKSDGVSEIETIKQEDDNKKGLKCPECGGPAVLSEGCVLCPLCGSKCG